MKKSFAIAVCLCAVLSFVSNYVLAEEVFLTLTKYEANIEKLPVNITVITQEEMQEKHVENLGELLRNEVGIDYKGYGSLGANISVMIRGSKSEHTLVLIDGVRINDLGLGTPDFNVIPVSAIEKIEIIRGAGSAVYGGAFGGVINVITKKSKKGFEANGGFLYGSFNAFSANGQISYGSGKFGALASAATTHNGGNRDNSYFHGGNFFFNGYVGVSEKSVLALTASKYNSTIGVPGSLSTPTPNEKQEEDNSYIKAVYETSFSQEDKIKISAYRTENIRQAVNTSYDDSKYTNETFGFQMDYVSEDFLLIGGEGWVEKYKNENKTYSSVVSNYRNNTAVYAKANIDISDLRIIPGARYDSNSQYGEVFTPAISFVFNATDKIKISANTGKVWSAPNFTAVDPIFVGNPDIKPEEGISSDIGAQYVGKKIKALFNVFYIQSKNLITWLETSPFVWEPVNVDKSKQYGLELEGGYIFNSWLSNKINYTWLQTEDEKINRPLIYRPEHTINYTLTFKPISRLTFDAIIYWRSNQYDENYKTLNGFTTFDLNINYNVATDINIWVKGFNLGNSKYQMTKDYPMPGATVYVGVDFKFWK